MSSVANTSGTVAVKGVGMVTFTEGAVFADDDPVVKAAPGLFSPTEAVERSVETATAAPGEKRAVKKPGKKKSTDEE